MRQWINLHRLVEISAVDLADARERVGAANVHCTRATDALATRSTESERWIDLIFDLDQRVEHHRAAAGQIDFVALHVRLLLGLVRIPAVDFECFDALGCIGGG